MLSIAKKMYQDNYLFCKNGLFLIKYFGGLYETSLWYNSNWVNHLHFSIFSLFFSLSATPVITSVYSLAMSVLEARAFIGFLVVPLRLCTWTFFFMTRSDCLSTASKSSRDKSTGSTFFDCSMLLKNVSNVKSSGLETDTFLPEALVEESEPTK